MKGELDTLSGEQREAEGSEPQPGEAVSAAPGEFEAEEQRFFSEPPEPYEEAAKLSLEHEHGNTERAMPSARAVSLAAVEREIEADSPERAELLPLSARQRQLRRRVAGSMGAMLAFLLFGFVARKGIEASERAHEAMKPAAAPALIAQAAIVPTSTPAVTTPASTTPALTTPALTTPAIPTSQTSAVEIPAPPAASANDATDPVAEADSAALIRSARSLLSAGHTRDGVVVARVAVQKNPLDAEPYILLAAGLQDLGAWHEARDVFADCLRKAKRGTSSACQYFARR